MIRTISIVSLPIFTILTSFASVSARSEAGLVKGGFVGGPHGTPFDDGSMINGADHRRISAITLYGCFDDEHPFGLSTTYRKWEWSGPVAQEFTATHGSDHPTDKMHLDLAADEYITDLWFTTYRAKHGFANYYTRIGSMAIKTNKGQEIKQCGADDKHDQHWQLNADNGALLYLTGATGKGIDNIVPYWIPTENF